MSGQYGGSVVPKRGDRVGTDKQPGVFEVVDINPAHADGQGKGY